jgi:ketosteroid isomerase-like protein
VEVILVGPEEVARLYVAYFNERRLDESGQQLVHPDAEYIYPATGQHLKGRAGHRALAATWLVAFEDARMEITAVTTARDGTVVVDFVGTGTHTGDLVFWEDKVVPATGRAVALPFRYTLTVRDGLIVRAVLDFSVVDLLRQVGSEAR